MIKWVKLGNIIKITSGGTPLTSRREYYESGTIPWVKTGDLKVTFLTEVPDKITELGLANSSSKIFPINTVLLAMYGATIGNCSILKIEAATNQACAAFLPNENVYPEYLYSYLSSIKKHLVGRGKGGGQPNISATILKETKFPLLPVPDQIHIATLLIRAEGLIEQRKESLRLLDELVKGVFLEMFGDPVKNEKGWEKINLGKLGNWRSGGTPSRSNNSYFEGDIPWLTSGELNSIFISNSKEKISKEAVTNSNAKLIEIGSLLLGMYDTAALKSSISDSLVTCNQAIAFAKLNADICNTIFIYYYIQLGKKYFKRQQRGVRQKNLNLSMIKALEVIIPPLSLQIQFATLVGEVESLRKHYTASLKELENLYSALSGRAFRGELSMSGMELSVEETAPFESDEPEQIETLSLGEQLVQLQQQMAKAYEPILASMKIIQSTNRPIADAIATVSATFRHLEPIDKPAISAIRTLSKAFEATDLDFKKLSKQISDGLSQYKGFQQDWADLIQQMQSRKYTFDALWEREMEGQDYENMKRMLFDWVKGESPFMEQFFDETDHQIKFRLRETPST